MTFIIFLVRSDGDVNERGERTLGDAYLTRHASNYVHSGQIWLLTELASD